MAWYAAHVVIAIELLEGEQDVFPFWENVLLIEADSPQLAREEATARALDSCSVQDKSMSWGGIPARHVFRGIRKIIECEDAPEAPKSGSEITYSLFEVSTADEVDLFLRGQSVRIACIE